MSVFTLIDRASHAAVIAPDPGELTYYSVGGIPYVKTPANLVIQLSGGVPRVEVSDIANPSAELNAIAGVAQGDLVVVSEHNVAAIDAGTIYYWDPSPGGAENVPFTVDGLAGGRWIALSGRYANNVLESAAQSNKLRFHFAVYGDLPDPGDFHGMFAHVHDVGNPLQGESAYFAHQGAWQRLKDHHQDVQSVLTSAAGIAIDFGRQSDAFKTLTLLSAATFSFDNPIAGVDRWLEINGNFAVTWPGSATVYGAHIQGAKNLVSIKCVDAGTPKFDVLIIQEGALAQASLISETDARAGISTAVEAWSAERVRQTAESVIHDGVPFAYHLGGDAIKLDQAKGGENWAVAVEAGKVDDPKPLKVLAFDDTIEEGVGFKNPVYIPPKTTGIRFKLMTRAATAPGADATVGIKMYTQQFVSGGLATPVWDAGLQLNDVTLPGGSSGWVIAGGVTSLGDLGLAAGDFIRLEFTRVAPLGGTNLVGDWKVLVIAIEFTQEEIP